MPAIGYQRPVVCFNNPSKSLDNEYFFVMFYTGMCRGNLIVHLPNMTSTLPLYPNLLPWRYSRGLLWLPGRTRYDWLEEKNSPVTVIWQNMDEGKPKMEASYFRAFSLFFAIFACSVSGYFLTRFCRIILASILSPSSRKASPCLRMASGSLLLSGYFLMTFS